MRPCTDSWVTSWPRNRMRPLSGGKSPEIRLTSVVLPAPLEPISASTSRSLTVKSTWSTAWVSPKYLTRFFVTRSEEHTSELQSLAYLVCRLLLEKKKKNVNSQDDTVDV